MNFFPDDPPADDQPEFETPQNPRWKPSDLELPRLFPIAEALVVTDTVAIIVMGARVYSTGVEFMIERRMRRGERTEQEWHVAQWQFHGMHGRPDPGRLRYGVALGDGQHVLLDAFGMMHLGEEAEPAGHSLFPTNGNGSGSGDIYVNQDGMWLWPLPPEGSIEIVAQWPAEGVGESRVVIDSAPLRELAAAVRPIWE
ncbi:hypothetical protein ACFVU2_17090 [Leifsonia sp. NPDC058194]|uniref:hypothetical protein n=1 Tax=Leifsonia sp. NPDC058194 TaxID=3346374 RepID=UPI0036DBEC43